LLSIQNNCAAPPDARRAKKKARSLPMRPFHTLLACALTTTAWFSVNPALAQVGPGVEVVAPVGSVDASAQPQVSISVTAPSVVIPAPIAQATPPTVAPQAPAPLPYAPSYAQQPVYVQPPIYVQPPVASPLPHSSVLLMPQDQLLAGRGTWERRGNDLYLHHKGTGTGRRSGMLAAGITLLSLGYTPALITGGLFTLFMGPNDVGSSLLIPVLGPFLSGFIALSGRNDLDMSGRGAQSWAWSWMLVDGAVQVTGLALLIAGARARPSGTPSFLERVHILPYSTQNGGGVTVSGKF
jgi:hypothetical protein